MTETFVISEHNVTFYTMKLFRKRVLDDGFFLFRTKDKSGTDDTVSGFVVNNVRFEPRNIFRDYSSSKVNDFNTEFKQDFWAYSEIRDMGFIIPDFKVRCKLNFNEAKALFDDIVNLIKTVDNNWKPKTTEEIEEYPYIDALKDEWRKILSEKIKEKSIETKRQSKNDAKKLIQYKYRIGDMFSLRYRTLHGDRISDDVYQVKKVIHSIGPNIVNILIMKKIIGEYDNDISRNMLTPNDCRIFHLKYEPGLMVFNMNERLYKIDKLNLEKKLLNGQ